MSMTKLVTGIATAVAIALAPVVYAPTAQADKASDQCNKAATAGGFFDKSAADACIAALRPQLAAAERDWESCVAQYKGGTNADGSKMDPKAMCGPDPGN